MSNDPKADERRDELAKRILRTPPLPRNAYKVGKPDPRKKSAVPDFVLIGSKFYVATIHNKKPESITADLYRNMDDFRVGAVMEKGVELDIAG